MVPMDANTARGYGCKSVSTLLASDGEHFALSGYWESGHYRWWYEATKDEVMARLGVTSEALDKFVGDIPSPTFGEALAELNATISTQTGSTGSATT